MASILDDKAVLFALEIIKLSKQLNKTHDYKMSDQILRSGTSVGANIREAQSAESKKDFVHKLSISQKEIGETRYWLELFVKSEMIEKSLFNKLDSQAIQIEKMLKSSILTTRQKYNLKRK